MAAWSKIDVRSLQKLRKEIYEKCNELLEDEKQGGAYLEEIDRYLKKHVLEDKLSKWLKKCGIEPIQGILYINSVVILYDGRIAVYFGENWREEGKEKENIKQEDWVNQAIFNKEGAEEIPYKNILSLCNDNREKLGLFPVLVFGDSELKYEHIKIDRYEVPSDLVDNPGKLGRQKKDIFARGSELYKVMQKFKAEIFSKYNITIDTDDDAEAYLLNPFRIATKYKAPNLFYIYDSREIKERGGIAFVANVNKSLEKDQIQRILHELQKYVCDYILTPILFAESEVLRNILEEKAGEVPYALRFFEAKPDEEIMDTRIPLVYNILNLGEDEGDEFNKKASLVKHRLKQFFASTTGSSGKAIREYGTFAEEAFLTTLGIWDDLEIAHNTVGKIRTDGGGYKEIKTIKQYWDEGRKQEPKLLINILFTALNFEPALKHIASYREHFIHCFHAFCFGFWLLCLKKRNGQYLFAPSFRNRLILLKSWFLAGTFHDIGIPIQKAGEYLQTLMESLIQREKLPIYPKWSDLIDIPNYHELLFSEQFNKLGQGGICAAKGEDILHALIRLNHKSIRLLLEKASHPVLGSLILYDNIKNLASTYKDIDELLPHVVMPVLVHHIWDKEWEEESKGGKGWQFGNFANHPLAYLLILCDAISQLDRRFEDIERSEELNRKDKSPIIKLYRLNNPNSNNNDCPECDLVYNLSSIKEMDKYLQYYQKPYDLLSSGDNSVLKVTLFHDLDRPKTYDDWTWTFKTP